MSRNYIRKDGRDFYGPATGFIENNNMGRKYVNVRNKKSKYTGLTVQQVGSVEATPLTYDEDDYIELAGLLHYGNKFTKTHTDAPLVINPGGRELFDAIVDSLVVDTSISAASTEHYHKDTSEIIDSIESISNAVGNKKMQNYAKNTFRSNENLAFMEGLVGDSAISLQLVCGNLKQNFNAFVRNFHDANAQLFDTWKTNIIANTIDSMDLQYITPDFVKLILFNVIEICRKKRSFKLQEFQDGRKKRSKSVDGRKRRSKRSKRSKSSKRSKRSKRSKSVDGRKKRSRSMSTKKLLKLLRKM